MPYSSGPTLETAAPTILAELPPFGDGRMLELQSFTTSKDVLDLYLAQAVDTDLHIHHYRRQAPAWTFVYAGRQVRVGGGHGSNISRGTKHIWQSWPEGGQDVVRLPYSNGTAHKTDGQVMRVGTDWFATPALDVTNNLLLLRVVNGGKEWYRVCPLNAVTTSAPPVGRPAEFGGWAQGKWGAWQGCAIRGKYVYFVTGGTTGAAKWASGDVSQVLLHVFDWTTCQRVGTPLDITTWGLIPGQRAMSSEVEDLEVLELDLGDGPQLCLVAAFKVGSGTPGGPTARRVRLVIIAQAPT